MTIATWKKITQHAGILLSVTAHAALLFAIVLVNRASHPMQKYGNQKPALPAYLTSLPAARPSVEPLKQALALTLLKKPVTHAQQPAAIAQQTFSLPGKPMPELIALLHAAIERHQHYPASAEEMEQTGRVTLAFTLFTNGTISHPAILHSSGTASLDYAALAAVNDAAPFPQVSRYIQSAQAYKIDVVFESG